MLVFTGFLLRAYFFSRAKKRQKPGFPMGDVFLFFTKIKNKLRVALSFVTMCYTVCDVWCLLYFGKFGSAVCWFLMLLFVDDVG